MNNDPLKEISEKLGITLEFTEKLLLLEKLTKAAQANQGDARYENLTNEECLPGSMTTTAIRLRSLILSFTKQENQVVENYLGKDYWCPGYWSAGGY